MSYTYQGAKQEARKGGDPSPPFLMVSLRVLFTVNEHLPGQLQSNSFLDKAKLTFAVFCDVAIQQLFNFLEQLPEDFCLFHYIASPSVRHSLLAQNVIENPVVFRELVGVFFHPIP